ERRPGARVAPGGLQRAHRAVRGAGARARPARAHRGGAGLPERLVLLPRLAGGVAGRVGRGRPDVRAVARRRRPHPLRRGRAGAAGRDRAPHRAAGHRGARHRAGEGGAVSDEMLRLEGVVKRYGSFTAVAGLDLVVKRGEIFGFLGPNGAGKTTTIRMAAGVLEPSAGRILIGGSDVKLEPEAAKGRIGYIPDRPFLYEKLSGREFLRFVAGLWGRDGAETEARADRLLELFSLADWKDELI